MKIHREGKGPRSAKAREVLRVTEGTDSGCSFDPEQEISKEVLAGLEKLIQRPKFLEDNTSLRDLLLLGIVLPKYRSNISEMEYRRIDGGFVTLKEWLLDKFVSEYQGDMAWGEDSGKSAIIYKKIAHWIYFFPNLPEEVADKLRYYSERPNLSEAIDQTLHIEGTQPGHSALGGRLSALIQLFPKERLRLIQEADEVVLYKEGIDLLKTWYLKEGHLLAVLEGCSELALIFPEHKDDILDFIRPYWEKIKEGVKEYGRQVFFTFPPNQFSDQKLHEYIEAVIALTVLSSTVAFSPDRTIEFSRRGKSIRQSPPLPDRLTA